MNPTFVRALQFTLPVCIERVLGHLTVLNISGHVFRTLVLAENSKATFHPQQRTCSWGHGSLIGTHLRPHNPPNARSPRSIKKFSGKSAKSVQFHRLLGSYGNPIAVVKSHVRSESLEKRLYVNSPSGLTIQ